MKKKYKPLLLFFLFITITLWFDQGIVLAQNRFVANGDGTVTDRESGLMWSQMDNRSDIYWKDAQQWIQTQFNLSTNRPHGNWRLPTVDELQSLYLDSADYEGYRTACGHGVKIIPQIRLSCILVWSSNSALGLPVAFNFYLGNAFTLDINDNAGCRILAVRDTN